MKDKGPFFIVPWRCTFACESNCVHCISADKPAVPDEVDTEGAKKIVDKVPISVQASLESRVGNLFLRKDLFRSNWITHEAWLEHQHHN